MACPTAFFEVRPHGNGRFTVGKLVRLVVADGHPAFAEGLAMILATEADFAVCGLTHDGGRAVELVAFHRPTVLLMDVQLPGGDPARISAAVRAASPATKVLLLSTGPTSTVAAAVAAGANGVVAKGGSSRQWADAIRRVVAGKRVMVVGARPPRPSRDSSVEQVRVGALSQRELEVLGLLASGWSSRRIAQAWQVAPATVRSHVQNLLVKLGVHSQLEAVAYAFQHGIVAGAAAPGEQPRSGWARSRPGGKGFAIGQPRELVTRCQRTVPMPCCNDTAACGA
jgi:DNA-binding NarL/FixJ family response regulator